MHHYQLLVNCLFTFSLLRLVIFQLRNKFCNYELMKLAEMYKIVRNILTIFLLILVVNGVAKMIATLV